MMRAGEDYGVRVIRAYETRRVGQVFYPPALLRDALVRGGFVERVIQREQIAPAASESSTAKRPVLTLAKKR